MRRVSRLQRRGDDLLVAQPTTLVRQAPHADDFLDTEGKIQGRGLRQDRQAPGALGTLPLGQWPVIQPDLPLGRAQLAAQPRQKGTFARTVGPEHAEHFARVELEIDVRQYRLAATVDVQVLRSQHQARPRTNR
ncbi:hypothetical protein D9M68_844440 [compost metagenome]